MTFRVQHRQMRQVSARTSDASLRPEYVVGALVFVDKVMTTRCEISLCRNYTVADQPPQFDANQ